MKPDTEKIPAVAHPFRFQWEPSQEAYVLLYPEGMIKLNPTAGEILAAMDGEKTVEEIVKGLQAKFNHAEGIEEDVLSFLKESHEREWIAYQ